MTRDWESPPPATTNEALRTSNDLLREEVKALKEVLGKALAAVWDGHYSGKGVSTEYARTITKAAERVGVKL